MEKEVFISSEKDQNSMRTMRTGWLIFALVMLFNPNIQLIDLLPDFIGFLYLQDFLKKHPMPRLILKRQEAHL